MLNRYNKSLKMFMVVGLVGLLSVFVIGCGDDDDADDVVNELPPTDMIIIGESGNLVDMNGTWAGACLPDVNDGSSETVSTVIAGADFTQTESLWAQVLDCSGQKDVTSVSKGTVTLGDEKTVDNGGDDVTAVKIDGVLMSVMITPNSQVAADDFNLAMQCGFDDWAVGVAKEVLGTACAPDSDFKDVMYVDDTEDPDEWYSGDDDVLDADGYPVAVGADGPKLRQ